MDQSASWQLTARQIWLCKVGNHWKQRRHCAVLTFARCLNVSLISIALLCNFSGLQRYWISELLLRSNMYDILKQFFKHTRRTTKSLSFYEVYNTQIFAFIIVHDLMRVT